MIKFGSLLVLLAVPLTLPGEAVAQSVTPVSITLTNYAFNPGALTLQTGVTYQMHFINSGSKDDRVRSTVAELTVPTVE